MDTYYICEEQSLVDIADAIREKTGSTEQMTIAEMITTIDEYEAKDTSAELVDGSVTEFTNDEVTSIGGYTFAGCSLLQSINIPNCTSIGSYAFTNCTSLQSVNFPVCTSIGNYAFNRCTSLQSVDFPVCTNMSRNAFDNCISLMSLTLGASLVVALSDANAFYNTPMSKSTYTGTFGSIYVPASLVDAYKTATNWSVYADRITSMIE